MRVSAMKRLLPRKGGNGRKWLGFLATMMLVPFLAKTFFTGVFGAAGIALACLTVGLGLTWWMWRKALKAEPIPGPGVIKSAELTLATFVLATVAATPTGWGPDGAALSVAVTTALAIAAVWFAGRQGAKWQPQASQFGRLVDAASMTLRRERCGLVLAGIAVASVEAFTGLPGPLAMLLGLTIAALPSLRHWKAAKAAAGTRAQFHHAFTGFFKGGRWTSALEALERVPINRFTLTPDGRPGDVEMPVPRQIGAKEQETLSDLIDSGMSEWGQYAIQWNSRARTVTIRAVPPLPTSLRYDGRPAAGPHGLKIWLGVGRVNREMVRAIPTLTVGETQDVYLDLAKDPHALYVGTTGTGKSIAIFLTVLQFIRAGRGNKVLLIDPKKVSFTRAMGKKGVLRVATEPLEMAASLKAVVAEMNARNSLLMERKIDNIADLPERERPPRLLVVVDEATEAVVKKDVERDDEEGKALNRAGAEVRDAMSSLSRLARSAGIHLLVCTQRPDTAEAMNGSTRENLPGRLMMGSGLSDDGRKMMGFNKYNVNATPNVVGRGLFGTGGPPCELQVAFAPVTDFDRWLEDATPPAVVDADGDGVESLSERYAAADGEADRLAVLREAGDTLTDEDAQACGYADLAAVQSRLAAFDEQVARTQALIEEERLLDRLPPAPNRQTPPAPVDHPPVPDGHVGDGRDQRRSDLQETRRHTGNRIEPFPPGEAKKEMEKLIGLEATKAEIRALEAAVMVETARAKHGLGTGRVEPPNIVAAGPPGVGKTIVAKILGSLLRDAGVLTSGHVIALKPSSIIAPHVGQSAPMASSAFDDAEGGLLFLDEAYGLRSNDFGREALEELMVRMEDDRTSCAVVLAGYPKEMSDLLDLNPGLRSRLPHRIDFPAYTRAELLQIAELMVNEEHRVISEAGKAAFAVLLEQQDLDSKDWGNGRSVRVLVERATRRQSERLVARMRTGDEPTKLDLATLLPEDILPSGDDSLDAGLVQDLPEFDLPSETPEDSGVEREGEPVGMAAGDPDAAALSCDDYLSLFGGR